MHQSGAHFKGSIGEDSKTGITPLGGLEGVFDEN